MTVGPSWLAHTLAIVTLSTAAYGAGRRLPAVGAVLGIGLPGYAWWAALRVAGPARYGDGAGFVAPRLATCCEVAMPLVMAVPLIGMA